MPALVETPHHSTGSLSRFLFFAQKPAPSKTESAFARGFHSGSYSTGTGNRITADGTYTYQYDKEGNRTRRTKVSDSSYEEYTWDFRNRLTKVEFKDHSSTTLRVVDFSYDPFNRLVRRTLDPDGPGGAAATDQFFAGYVGLNPTLEFDADDDDDVSHRYLWGPGFDMLLADEQISSVNSAGNTLWPLADHLGTIRDIADYNEGSPEFEVTNHRVYDSFGRLESETDSGVDVAFGFTGKYTDEDTLYTQHLFRWYDPRTGRWLSEDPIGFAAGDSNLTRYVGNEAVGYVDTMGLFEQGMGYDGYSATATAAASKRESASNGGGGQGQDDDPLFDSPPWWRDGWLDIINPLTLSARLGENLGGARAGDKFGKALRWGESSRIDGELRRTIRSNAANNPGSQAYSEMFQGSYHATPTETDQITAFALIAVNWNASAGTFVLPGGSYGTLPEALNSLPGKAGKGEATIKWVPDLKAFDEFYQSITRSAAPRTAPPRFDGPWFEMTDGTAFGRRISSTTNDATLTINLPNGKTVTVHIDPKNR